MNLTAKEIEALLEAAKREAADLYPHDHSKEWGPVYRSAIRKLTEAKGKAA